MVETPTLPAARRPRANSSSARPRQLWPPRPTRARSARVSSSPRRLRGRRGRTARHRLGHLHGWHDGPGHFDSEQLGRRHLFHDQLERRHPLDHGGVRGRRRFCREHVEHDQSGCQPGEHEHDGYRLGQPEYVSARASPSPPPSVRAVGTPTGSVTFEDGSTVLGTDLAVMLRALPRSRTTALAVGPHSLVAVYNGSGSYASSQSSNLALTVEPGGDHDKSDELNPDAGGGPVRDLRRDRGGGRTGGGVPTGMVVFDDGSTVIGTAPVSGGQAVPHRCVLRGRHART